MRALAKILVSIYVLVQTQQGDMIRQYDGATEQEVATAIQSEGRTFQFITAEQFKARQVKEEAALRPAPESASRLAAKRLAIFTVKLSTATPTQKVNAVILLLDLDR